MLEGTWELEVDTPFGKHPAMLTIERGDDTPSATINSRLREIALTDIKVNGGDFEAEASYDFCGKTYTARLQGQAEGDQMSGTINVRFPFAPKVRFTGRRAA